MSVSPLLVVYDDAQARQFAPFSLTRPLAALRAGAGRIGDRWSRAVNPGTTAHLSSSHLDAFAWSDGNTGARGVLAPGTIIANARCVLSRDAHIESGDTWTVGGDVAAVRLARALPAEALHDGSLDLASLAPAGARQELRGRWLDAPWDLIGQLPDQILEDARSLADELQDSGSAAGHRIGTNRVVIERDAVVEPFVVFDTTLGPVIVHAHAHVHAFSRIAGPCVIGRHTQILGGRISGSAFGPDCRVHGDVSASIFVSHANKAHEGFVGHTVVGQWANLGAGTTTSNLKNSYGAVRIWAPDGERSSGLTFLGSLIGDHAKLGIGTMLGTGTVIGAGANVFGGGQPPKHVAPFAWGSSDPFETFACDKFLAVAERVMQRRKISLRDTERDLLTQAHHLAETGDW